MTERPTGRLAPKAGRPSSLSVEFGADDACAGAGAAADVAAAAAADVTPAAAAGMAAVAAAADVAAAAAVTPEPEVSAALDARDDSPPEQAASPSSTARLPAVAAMA